MPKPIPPQLSGQLLDTLEELIDHWRDNGYCPHCLARNLLLHAGLLAAHELEQDEMREALTYVADLSAQHCPSQGDRDAH